MNLNREILRLSVPSILANITVPLVGMVDIAVVGHLGGEAAVLIGGISIGSMLFDLLYWSFAFLRTGTGGLTAQAYGRGDNAAVAATLRRALRIALLSGVALLALQWPVAWAAFQLIPCSPAVQEMARRYFFLRIWAAPATLSLFALKGWFIGMQDSLRPMTADLLVNGVNILLSVVLSYGLPGLWNGLGFSGVALGTVIAQWSGFLYCLLALRRRYRPVLEAKKTADTTWNAGAFFALNRDLVLRSFGMIAVYIGFTFLSARYGDLMLAVSSILMKFLLIFSYFTDGFAYAGEALTGRFIGERSAPGIRSAVRGTFVWSGGVALVFIALYGLGGMPLLRLMSSDTSVVEAGRAFLPWLLLMPLIGCPAFVWDGIFIGATAGPELRNSTLLCALGFFAVWWGLSRLHPPGIDPEVYGIHALLAAYFVHLLIRALYLTLRYRAAVLSRV